MTFERHLAARRTLARLALVWEVLWPALVPALCIVGLFLALALMDLPAHLPGWLHLVLLLVFAGALIAAVWFGVRRFALPQTAAAERRLERDSGLRHQPIAALQDTLTDTRDPATYALWREHKRRLLAQMGRLAVGWPRPGVPRRDPWGLRAVVFLLLAIGIVVGIDDAPARVARALVPDLSGPPPPEAKLEAWINPPTYTGVAPIRLLPETPTPVRVPVGSTLLARLYGGAGDAVVHIDKAATPFERVDQLNQKIERPIDAGSEIALTQGETQINAWPIDVIPDAKPTVSLGEGPQVTVRNVLRIDYQARDDYGLASVTAYLRLADQDGAAKNDEVVELPLPLAQLGAKTAEDSGFHDLTPHPWAGLPVVLWVAARDSADQEGRSEEVELVLPERTFNHPVAKAIIEQRRILARHPERRAIVARALNAITAVPQTYGDDVVVHLALRTAVNRLRGRADRAVIADVQELLWDTALRLEDGKMSLAERELRAAQKELMDALARNADDQEVERLMDKLQQAMERYLQALAEDLQRQMQEGAELQPIDPNGRMLQSDDLRRMLDRARELSRMGARDAAREMLRQLQEMLENLQNRAVAGMPQQMQKGQQAMRDLGSLMQRQQRLLDQTFRQTPRSPGDQSGQRQPNQGQPNQGQQGGQEQGQRGQGQQGEGEQANGLNGLAGEQEAVRRQLGEIMRRMGEILGSIPGSLGRAERFMSEARRALREGSGEQAVTAETEALDQLAEGMRTMADQLQQQAGEGQPGANQSDMQQVDPLGRPLEDGGVDTGRVHIPDDWELQRAREILNELRRRAGQAGRPPEERQYIDRLLRQF